jgi:hypothetical protein
VNDTIIDTQTSSNNNNSMNSSMIKSHLLSDNLDMDSKQEEQRRIRMSHAKRKYRERASFIRHTNGSFASSNVDVEGRYLGSSDLSASSSVISDAMRHNKKSWGS